MDRERFPDLVKHLYEIVAELQLMFPGRHFTPDGHMVGSLGECLAAHHYGLTLVQASTRGYDAVNDGRKVEIKATQGKMVSIRSCPEYLLVLKLDKLGGFEEIYNGPGFIVWGKVSHKPIPKNGQYQIGIGVLRKLMEIVPESERLKRRIHSS